LNYSMMRPHIASFSMIWLAVFASVKSTNKSVLSNIPNFSQYIC
jgi:hypothetical protein